jgi:hypothetical protein
MLTIPRDVNPRDIEQWCSSGVVMYQTPEATLAGWYLGCTPSRTITVMPITGGEHVLVPAAQVAVHWPMCGSVNIRGKPYAAHVERLTQRQYRRTWHRAGVKVVIPREWDVTRHMSGMMHTLSPSDTELALACFEPEYPTLETALSMLDSGDVVTVATSPRLIVAGDALGKRMFYYNGELAATATANNELFPVGDEALVRRIIKLTEGRYHARTYR